MGKRITIRAGGVAAEAELNDSPAAERVGNALPIEASATTWGEEIYFGIGVKCPLSDDGRENMDVGELAYWPPGEALCIFFGPTPASEPGGGPRAASAVNPIGRILGDPAALKSVTDGQTIVIEAAG